MKKTLTNCSGHYRSDMQGYNRLLIPSVDKQANTVLHINNELLLVRPMNETSTLTLHGRGINVNSKNAINSAVLLASNDNLMVELVDEWSVEKFTLSQISTLFCFLDYQTKNRKLNGDKQSGSNNDIRQSDKDQADNDLADNERHVILLLENNSDRLMDLLITGIINPEKQCMQSIFSFIRNMESYWIAYFLLSQVFSNDSDSDSYKLYNACKVYGVSESYFRKLCHNAFTCGPKKQLRMWRAAHSALQLIEKDKSIATIAGNNGYSSSSHFSSEIKSIFGMTPREFKKLEGLLHE